MSGWRWRRIRTRVARSIWIIPAVYVIVALALAVLLVNWDVTSPLQSPLDLSSSSASTALAALGSGMIAFTGFVTSVVLLVVQFGSSQFSPRFLRWFRDDPTIKHSLGTFFATFLFALVATALTGRGADDVVPYRALLGALVLSVASIGWFLALISHTSNNLRVAHVTQRVDAQARKVFDTVYPTGHTEVQAARAAVQELDGSDPVQELRRDDVGMILVAVDRVALLRLAVDHDAVIELVAAVGDHVATGGLILRVYGRKPIPHRRFRSGVFFGDERTIEDDPAFAIRLLVDVAIKALSPAVNDPTTAVQSIHRIEDVLRYASAKHLSVGVVTDSGNRARVIIPTPSWNDLVSLSLDEIRSFGADQYQIARRLRALLEDLLTDLPDERRPALQEQLRLLDEAVAAQFPGSQRADALVADRQGLGLGRDWH
jgi:uncharacterized membrane protein